MPFRSHKTFGSNMWTSVEFMKRASLLYLVRHVSAAAAWLQAKVQTERSFTLREPHLRSSVRCFSTDGKKEKGDSCKHSEAVGHFDTTLTTLLWGTKPCVYLLTSLTSSLTFDLVLYMIFIWSYLKMHFEPSLKIIKWLLGGLRVLICSPPLMLLVWIRAS